MKTLCRFFLQLYLKLITKLVLLIHRPFIIAIAGSANKTFFKEKINSDLRLLGLDIRSNPKSFNTRVGLPLAILDLPSGYHSYVRWLPIIIKAPLRLFKKCPKIMILELGVWNPGDMKYLLSIIRPKAAIVTDLTQKYLEGFADVEELFEEYECLVKKIRPEGFLVLNYDNARVRKIANIARAPISFFSVQKNFEEQPERGELWRALEIIKEESGEKIRVKHGQKETVFHLRGFGRHHAYALLASLIIQEKIGIIGNYKNA